MQKTLDAKLADIRQNSRSDAFIIAYAADSDMARGLLTLDERSRSIQAYCEELTTIVEQGKIDILLTSVANMDILARGERLFDHSPVTPAIRANDTTDIWKVRGATYADHPSKPFATTTIEEAQYGTLNPAPDQQPDVDLGLYSVTFNNDLEADCYSLECFKDFRTEATRKGFRYFLEVFNPNVADCGIEPAQIPHYVNDHIARMLAGIPRASRPEFLKIAYNGPETMEALVSYDSSLVVGILGGEASTTYDAYRLISEAKKHGARLTLFGRRIKGSEDPLSFLEVLRQVADGHVGPEEGVRQYRCLLDDKGIAAARSLDDDMILHSPGLIGS
jgi:hypothetical protein